MFAPQVPWMLPDVNPDPGAHEEFVRVQAAYMKLSKPGDRETAIC